MELTVGPKAGEGEAAGGVDVGRMVAEDDDGGVLTVVVPQATTSAVTSEAARSRRFVIDA